MTRLNPGDLRRPGGSDLADKLTADRYPGALSIASQQEVLDILGRPVASEQDIEQLAANLDMTASELGG
jgi:hypothetical protein